MNTGVVMPLFGSFADRELRTVRVGILTPESLAEGRRFLSTDE